MRSLFTPIFATRSQGSLLSLSHRKIPRERFLSIGEQQALGQAALSECTLCLARNRRSFEGSLSLSRILALRAREIPRRAVLDRASRPQHNIKESGSLVPQINVAFAASGTTGTEGRNEEVHRGVRCIEKGGGGRGFCGLRCVRAPRKLALSRDGRGGARRAPAIELLYR